MERRRRLQSPRQPAHDYLGSRLPECFSAPDAASGLWFYDLQPDTTNAANSKVDISRSLPLKSTGSDDESDANGSQAVESWRLLSSLQQLHASMEPPSEKFFLIRQKHSRSRLGISQEFFEAFAGRCQLGSAVSLALACFGLSSGEDELGPPAAVIQWAPSPRREEVQLECLFTLVFAERHHRPTDHTPWSVRKTLVFHRYGDERHAGLLFMITSTNLISETAARYLYDQHQSAAKINAADLDCQLVGIAASTWRPYLIWLADSVRKKADRAIVADFNSEGVRLSRLEEQQSLKVLEDSIIDATAALDTISSTAAQMLRAFSKISEKHTSHAIHAVEGLLVELEYLQKQARTLLKKAQGSRVLVAEILQLDNGNALQLLAIESRNENRIMQELTEKATRDAAAVKALTVITLVYLPTTAVLNFFSNGLVGFSERSRLEVASNWWIFVVFALPLTIFTLCAWRIYVSITVYGRSPRWLSWIWSRKTRLTG